MHDAIPRGSNQDGSKQCEGVGESTSDEGRSVSETLLPLFYEKREHTSASPS